jgi:hypothetical protein
MTKVFNFGKIDFNGTGRRINAVDVEVELKDTDKGPEFSASAEVWNGPHTDIVMGGQCLDELAKHIHAPEFKKILRFWRLYHLNGMHPECEHQHALGWAEKAGQKVKIYCFSMTTEAITEQNKAKQAAAEALKAGATFTPTDEQHFFAALEYEIKTPLEHLPDNIKDYYKPGSCIDPPCEEKLLGWLSPEEHPDGLLGRACPVCGYKYGHDWKYFPIPETDLNEIKELLK